MDNAFLPAGAGLLILAGITSILALLLEVADYFFQDYGDCAININSGKKNLTVKGGASLLSSLMDQGIFIPSACGGRASCGLCKVKVISGAGPLLPTEAPFLSPKELQDGVRLSCQVKVRRDLSLLMDEALFAIREFSARVASARMVTETIREIRLDLMEPREISFKSGQFIQFHVPAYQESSEPVYRAYSIASAQADSGGLTLLVTRVPKGIASTYIHEHLKPGNQVKISGPYGEFYLRDSDHEIIMIATGSGLAPLVSLLHQLAAKGSTRKITLFFGTYRPADIFYRQEIEELGKKLPGFTFVPVLSGAKPEDDWKGETGIVTAPVKRLLEQHPSTRDAYLCGNPLMIDTAVKMFTENGIPAERIYYDKFA
ncbi:MAG: 2Fe-2S iron-sulfur cluster binding domain-containing protein [Thermodesulfobacteriota bacterium]